MKRTPLIRRTPLAKVNNKRKRKLYAKNFGDYADLIRQMPCVVCGRFDCEPHHVKSRGAGGDKSSLVPLDRRCHIMFHAMGKESFERRFMIDLESEAALLWHEFGGDGERDG